jgi:hypothetical protein
MGLTALLALWALVLGDDEEAKALRATDETFFFQDVGGLVYSGARDVEFLGDVPLGWDPTSCRQFAGQDAVPQLVGDLLVDRDFAAAIDLHLTSVDNPW